MGCYVLYRPQQMTEEPPPQSISELQNDLEFAVRLHIEQKKSETAERVKEALRRLDIKRKFQNGKR